VAAPPILINDARHFIHSMFNYHNSHSKDVPIRAGLITSDLERGAYPITDRSSLEDAMHAYGRAKEQEVAKQHIVAKALCLT
jgi:hypothetical protein